MAGRGLAKGITAMNTLRSATVLPSLQSPKQCVDPRGLWISKSVWIQIGLLNCNGSAVQRRTAASQRAGGSCTELRQGCGKASVWRREAACCGLCRSGQQPRWQGGGLIRTWTPSNQLPAPISAVHDQQLALERSAVAAQAASNLYPASLWVVPLPCSSEGTTSTGWKALPAACWSHRQDTGDSRETSRQQHNHGRGMQNACWWAHTAAWCSCKLVHGKGLGRQLTC